MKKQELRRDVFRDNIVKTIQYFTIDFQKYNPTMPIKTKINKNNKN